MNLYFLKRSALCLISFLGFINYEVAASGDASLIIQPKLANNDLALIDVIFKSDYSVNIANKYNTQFYILPGRYPEITISANFRNGPIENFPCSPKDVTVEENSYLYINVTSYRNKPDKPICTLSISNPTYKK